MGKYGAMSAGFTCAFSSKLQKCRNKKERETMLLNATDKDKNMVLNTNQISGDDYEMHLLLKQYNLGTAPKKELYEMLVNLKIISE
jgi:Tfp pilus assembly protein PilO